MALQTLMSGLLEESWILILASSFNLGDYVVLIEGYEEYLASHRYACH